MASARKLTDQANPSLAAIDTSKNGIVDTADKRSELTIVGYFWGGINAAWCAIVYNLKTGKDDQDLRLSRHQGKGRV